MCIAVRIILMRLTFYKKNGILWLRMEEVILGQFEQAEDMQIDGLKIVQDTRLWGIIYTPCIKTVCII